MATPRKKSARSWRGYALVAAGIVVVGGAFWLGITAQGSTAGQGSAADDPASGAPAADEPTIDLSRRIVDDPTALGDVNAPVVIVEYSDLRCPFCGVFARDTLPQIIDEYVASGDVRIEWRDVPLFGEESIGGAVAARAAGEQGLFWEYTQAVFEAAPDRGHADLPRERLIEFATAVDMPDLDAFVSDLDDPELLERVMADRAEAASIGATATPSFLVNDVPVSGAHPFDTFRNIIEAELAKAGK